MIVIEAIAKTSSTLPCLTFFRFDFPPPTTEDIAAVAFVTVIVFAVVEGTTEEGIAVAHTGSAVGVVIA